MDVSNLKFVGSTIQFKAHDSGSDDTYIQAICNQSTPLLLDIEGDQLVTLHNATIRMSNGIRRWMTNSNSQGRLDISRLRFGSYDVSINGGQSSRLLVATNVPSNRLDVSRYYEENDYTIVIHNTSGGVRISGQGIAYHQEEFHNEDLVISYNSSRSPGRLPPGIYTFEFYNPDDPCFYDNSLSCAVSSTMAELIRGYPSVIVHNYVNSSTYGIEIMAPFPSIVQLTGPYNGNSPTQTYRLDTNSRGVVYITSATTRFTLPEGSYEVSYLFDNTRSNYVNIDLTPEPMTLMTPEITLIEYYNQSDFVIRVRADPLSQLIMEENGRTFQFIVNGDGLYDITSTELSLSSGQHSIYSQNSSLRSTPASFTLESIPYPIPSVTIEYYNPDNYYVKIRGTPSTQVKVTQVYRDNPPYNYYYTPDSNYVVELTPDTNPNILSTMSTTFSYEYNGQEVSSAYRAELQLLNSPPPRMRMTSDGNMWVITIYGTPGYTARAYEPDSYDAIKFLEVLDNGTATLNIEPQPVEIYFTYGADGRYRSESIYIWP